MEEAEDSAEEAAEDLAVSAVEASEVVEQEDAGDDHPDLQAGIQFDFSIEY